MATSLCLFVLSYQHLTPIQLSLSKSPFPFQVLQQQVREIRIVIFLKIITNYASRRIAMHTRDIYGKADCVCVCVCLSVPAVNACSTVAM